MGEGRRPIRTPATKSDGLIFAIPCNHNLNAIATEGAESTMLCLEQTPLFDGQMQIEVQKLTMKRSLRLALIPVQVSR
jgi:hypothetical protein